jgi:hypothetical protein
LTFGYKLQVLRCFRETNHPASHSYRLAFRFCACGGKYFGCTNN